MVAAHENAKSAAYRLRILQEETLPASTRWLDIATTGYQSGRTDLLSLLTARRSVVDVESDIVLARATLDHSLADLDAAVGMMVPTVPLQAAIESSPDSIGATHAP